MKKKMGTMALAFVLTASVLMGCQASTGGTAATQTSTTEAQSTEAQAQEENTAEEAETIEVGTEAATEEAQTVEVTGKTVRVGSLKGATSIGLLKLMEDSKNQATANTYEFTMAAAADELLPKMVSGDLDIALVPANVASVLYGKTKGAIQVIDINTLGVLYMVSGDSTITQVSDLKGKTLYLTGKGTTPDYVLHYILSENGIADSDVTLEYKSEATEVAAVLAKEPEAIGLLPQPFVTAACMQNDKLQMVLDMTDEWKKLQGEQGSTLVTGVTVARKAFVEEAPEAVRAFMKEHRASAEYVSQNISQTAKWTEEQGIIAKAAIAEKAIPYCNITYMDGADMKQALSGYLTVLFEQDPVSVGGALPEADFYFTE